MSRLQPASPESSKTLRQLLDSITASRGWVSNALRSLSHAPEGLRRFQAVGHYGRYDTDLSERERELVILITGRGLAYAWGHHAPLGLQTGLTQDQLDAIRAGEVPRGLSDAEAALGAYTFEFSSGQGVNDGTFAALERHYTPRQITDISLISAYYMGLGAILAAFQVELEPEEVLQIELDWQRRKSSGA